MLIGERTTSTEHPRILKSDEPYLAAEELNREFGVLKAAMAARDVEAIQVVLERTVEGYHPSGEAAVREGADPALWPAASRTLH